MFETYGVEMTIVKHLHESACVSLTGYVWAKPARNLTTTPEGINFGRNLGSCFSLGVRAIFWVVNLPASAWSRCRGRSTWRGPLRAWPGHPPPSAHLLLLLLLWSLSLLSLFIIIRFIIIISSSSSSSSSMIIIGGFCIVYLSTFIIVVSLLLWFVVSPPSARLRPRPLRKTGNLHRVIYRSGIPRPIGDFPESLSQAMSVGCNVSRRIGRTCV